MQLRRFQARLRVLAETTRSFADAATDYQRLLEVVARSLAEVINDACGVFLLTPDGTTLVPVASHATDPAALRFIEATLSSKPVLVSEQAAARRVLQSGDALFIPHFDARTMRADRSAEYVDFEHELGVHSMLIVALRVRGRSIGMIAVTRFKRSSPAFDAHDLELAQTLADHAALAIENSRSYEAARAARDAAELATAELQRTQEAKRLLLEESPAPTLVFDTETHQILHANEVALRLYGYTQQEMQALKISDLRHPDDREQLAAMMRAAGTSGLRSVGRHRRKDGSTMYLEGDSRAATFAGRSARFAVFQDVTERHHAEEALRNSEHRLHSTLDSMLEGYFIFDREYRYTYMNDAGALQGRAPKEQLIGRSPLELFPGFEHSETFAAMQHVMQQRSVARIESVFTHLDGAQSWFELSIQPAPEGILILAVDVTERRRAQAALHASEARFETLARSGIISILVGDLTGLVSEANDAFLELIGYTREELQAGKIRWPALTPPEWQLECDAMIEQVTTQGSAVPREKAYLRKDGSRVPVLVGLARLGSASVIAFIVDLREQKRAEHALHSAEEQLRQAQKMEAVGRLAGGVAHDFNNMLSVILSYATMLLESARPGDPMRHDVEEIHKAAQRAAELTRQLLLFSRQQVVEPKIIDLNQVLLGMDTMLQRILGEDIDLVSSPARGIGRVCADPASLEQVIMNLVVNARDAMPTGGKLTIETDNVVLDEAYTSEHLGVQPGPHVMLAVSDTGCGMDKATCARIFEPFFTTKEMGKGTGLGLSMVFGIVRQSGGTIWVYSEPGQGTTFKIYLPRVDAAADAVQALSPSARPQGTETILLVEDEDQVRAVASSILKRNGYHVIEARHAREALLIAEQNPDSIHLLLTDVVMPQMSGPDLATRLTELRPQMRVLCMSGYTDDSIVRHGVLTNDIAYLQKPITPETLTRKVRDVLDAPLGARASLRAPDQRS